MDVLVTGNLLSVSEHVFDDIGKEYKCVNFHGKGEELCRIYSTYNFETVIYFSATIDEASDVFDELKQLETTLQLCKEHKIHNFIYIISNDQYGAEENITTSNRAILLQACKKLCQSYSAENENRMTILQVPYLYSANHTKNALCRMITSAKNEKENEIILSGTPDTVTDFLCEEDLRELVRRILDAPYEEPYLELMLSGENAMSMETLAGLIKKEIKGLKISYDRNHTNIPKAVKDGMARKEYGWTAMHLLDNDISTIIQLVKEQEDKKIVVREKEKTEKKWVKPVKATSELLVMFAGAIALQHWTRNNAMIGFLDFRFLFVVIMGMINGLNVGVAAAVLACMAYVVETAGNTHWQIIFYNVQNWLPFACYILIGAISGYMKDKYENALAFCKEEQAILEEKYIFLNEQYLTILQNKDSFNSQIIGYQNSFGKLYSVVKKLDSTLTNEVFFEAVNVMEDMLQTRSIAIYSISGASDYARLNVCSKQLHNQLGKSLVLSNYPEMIADLRNNKVFVNTECNKEYPTYATPIYKDDELLGMILLMNVEEQYMNMEFSNKLTILSDLIKDSLIRAMEHDNDSENMIEGTQIIQPEKFKEIVNVTEQMREKEYLQYALLRIYKDGVSHKEIADQVLSQVRTSDMLGMGEDNELYLLLSQTGREDLGIISERMKKYNIGFDVIRA
ncbi:MAG: NAD-dependent epimerase/dehydratase family protein [bacterium]|nr:NAD-dependent epimerase/dehydratase family protein [bacterium]